MHTHVCVYIVVKYVHTLYVIESGTDELGRGSFPEAAGTKINHQRLGVGNAAELGINGWSGSMDPKPRFRFRFRLHQTTHEGGKLAVDQAPLCPFCPPCPSRPSCPVMPVKSASQPAGPRMYVHVVMLYTGQRGCIVFSI